MSRSKDRARVMGMKRANPDYRGFRGYDQAHGAAGSAPLETVTCTVCGRRRNIAVGTAREQGDSYICLSCREAQQGVKGEDAVRT